VTRDPAEGVDADGYVVTGVSVDNVPPAYRPVVADCVAALTGFPELDGLYLYGSVATGQARPPASDLDLLALWTSTVDTSAVVAELSSRHRATVREVGLAHGRVDALAGEADGCFLKHYCVPLAGRDRRASLPRYRPSRALADGFNADLDTTLRSIVDGRAPDGRAPADQAPAERARRRVLLAVATIESVSHATWSTDRATGAALLRQHHPEWTDAVTGPADLDRVLALAAWLPTHP
jgi:uncharacterized protein